MSAIRPDGWTQAVRTLSGADTRAHVRALPQAMRVCIVHGDADVTTTPGQNRSVAHERPEVPLHVLPGEGHALYLEQPEAFNALVLRFAA